MQDCDPKTYSCTSSGGKDAKIAHIKRRVPLGEKTTHIDKAQMQNGYCKAAHTFDEPNTLVRPLRFCYVKRYKPT